MASQGHRSQKITYPNNRICFFNLHCHLPPYPFKLQRIFSTMFPLHQGNELCFQISSNHPHKIPQDLILSNPALYGSDITDDLGKSRRRKSISKDNDGTAENNDNDKKKLHRDIERQRRQEMATLYASLRSLLPLQYIKVRKVSYSCFYY